MVIILLQYAYVYSVIINMLINALYVALMQLVRAMIQPDPANRIESCRKAARFSFLTQGQWLIQSITKKSIDIKTNIIQKFSLIGMESFEETSRSLTNIGKAAPRPLSSEPITHQVESVKELSKWSKYTSPSVRILVDTSNKVPTPVKSPYKTSSIPISPTMTNNNIVVKRKADKPVSAIKVFEDLTIPASSIRKPKFFINSIISSILYSYPSFL